MDYDRAKRIGDEGERQVEDELARLSGLHRFEVLHDVLLEHGRETAQLDYVLVDRFGILILEAKVRSHAVIYGSDVEKRWTAWYSKTSKKSFQNPLKQNEQHEAVLRKAFKAYGQKLDPDYVKSAVVFVGADLSNLELDSTRKLKVIDIGDIEDFIVTRRDFAVNPGGSEQDIRSMVDTLRTLDSSANDRIREKHARQFRRRKGRSVANSGEARQGAPSSPDSILGRTGQVLWRFTLKLALVALVVGLSWWAFMGGGLQWLLESYGFGSVATERTQESAGGSAAATVDLSYAQATLYDLDPTLHSQVANLDTPDVVSEGAYVSYTWDYLAQPSANSVQVREVTITFDSATGEVRGIVMP